MSINATRLPNLFSNEKSFHKRVDKPEYHFYKEKTSKSLNDILLSNKYFSDHPKRIPPVIRALSIIANWNHSESYSITFKFWLNRFGSDYTDIISALEALELLLVHRTCRPKYTSNPYDIGKCYDYICTDKCLNALADVNKEYLYRIKNYIKEKRKLQKRLSKTGYNKVVYNNILDWHKHTIDGIKWDDDIFEIIDAYTPEKRESVSANLKVIVDKSYKTLSLDAKNGRPWNPSTQIPSEIAFNITVYNKPCIGQDDIQSCYPSLFASYIFGLYIPSHFYNNSIKCIPVTYPPIDYGKGDISHLFGVTDGISKELIDEVIDYNNVYLRPELKQRLTVLTGIPLVFIKSVILESLNGKTRGKWIRKYLKWFKTRFPLLYNKWQSTDVSQTGNQIGVKLESHLMLDCKIYELANVLGIELLYKYDAFYYYAKDVTNLPELRAFINKRCKELLGVELVFVSKKLMSIRDWMARPMIDVVKGLMEDIEEKMNKERRRIFKDKHKSKHDWTKYYAIGKKYLELDKQLEFLEGDKDKSQNADSPLIQTGK